MGIQGVLGQPSPQPASGQYLPHRGQHKVSNLRLIGLNTLVEWRVSSKDGRALRIGIEGAG